MITLSQVRITFGNTIAVDNVSLTVEKGEIFGLVGPDGAGKTSLIRSMTGILTADSGEVRIIGETRLTRVKEKLGYIPQRFSLYGDLTVMENISLLGSLYGAGKKQIRERARHILSFTGLLPFQDRLADNLSGGMKQKLALAAGLMHKPDLFFLDEPTTGVDPVSRREFWQMLYQMNKEGMTVFVSTPYMDEAELCHRVAFMHQGKLIACASPAELRRSYPYRLLELCVRVKDIQRYLEGIALEINAFGDKYHLVVTDPAEAERQIQEALAAAGIAVVSLREIQPDLEDVFVSLVGEVS